MVCHWVARASISFISLIVVGYSAGAAAEKGPLAKVSVAEHDFGRVMQGQKVTHEFSIQNTGDEDLILQRISPSCGCTAAAVASTTIKPGTKENVRVTFNTAGMYGNKSKIVSVLTNSRENPEVTLKMKGAVVRGITASPERLVFGEISQGASETVRTKEVSIAVTEGMDREVSQVTSGSKFVRVVPLEELGRAKRYAVTIGEDAPKGPLRERLVVAFKSPSQAPVNVPITATILGDLQLTPATVSFGIVSGAEPIERRVKFENASSKSVAITAVKTSHEAVTASMVDIEPGKRGVLVVRLDPLKVTGDLRATVAISTDHPEQDKLTVSVYGVQAPDKVQ